MKYWSSHGHHSTLVSKQMPTAISWWPLKLGSSDALLHRRHGNLCCFGEHRHLESSPCCATSLSPPTPPREKDTDPHHSQPALPVPFSVLQKLLAFLVSTSLFSNHPSPSPPPLEPPHNILQEIMPRGLHKRWGEKVSSGNLTHVWASPLEWGEGKTLGEYRYIEGIKFSWHIDKVLTQCYTCNELY